MQLIVWQERFDGDGEIIMVRLEETTNWAMVNSFLLSFYGNFERFDDPGTSRFSVLAYLCVIRGENG